MTVRRSWYFNIWVTWLSRCLCGYTTERPQILCQKKTCRGKFLQDSKKKMEGTIGNDLMVCVCVSVCLCVSRWVLFLWLWVWGCDRLCLSVCVCVCVCVSWNIHISDDRGVSTVGLIVALVLSCMFWLASEHIFTYTNRLEMLMITTGRNKWKTPYHLLHCNQSVKNFAYFTKNSCGTPMTRKEEVTWSNII